MHYFILNSKKLIYILIKPCKIRFVIGLVIGYLIGIGIDFEQSKKFELTTIKRPRYIYEELKNRHKLFIGVLLAENSRFTQEFDMHTFYFTNLKNDQKEDNVFVESKKELFDLKVTQYVINNYLSRYDWFFLAYSSTFYRPLMLNQIVNKLDWKKEIYLGYPIEELNLCSLDSGILISSSGLYRLNSVINFCVQHFEKALVNENKLGLCLKMFANSECTDKIKNKRLRFYTTANLKYEDATRRVHFNDSLTVSRINDAQTWQKITSHFNEIEIIKFQFEINKLESEINWFKNLTNYRKKESNGFLFWEYFNQTHILDLVNTFSYHKTNDSKFINEMLNESIKYLNKDKFDRYDFKRLLSGYKIISDDDYGQKYMLDILVNDKNENIYSVKRVHLFKDLGLPKMTKLSFKKQSEKSQLIDLLVAFREDDFEREHLRLVEIIKQTKMYYKSVNFLLISNNQSKLNYSQFDLKLFKIIFSKATINNTSQYYSDDFIQIFTIKFYSKSFVSDSLVLYVPSCANFGSDFLNRVLLNTVQNERVFFPIAFNQYINSNTSGYFNTYSYEFVSFYYSDFEKLNIGQNIFQMFDISKILQATDSDLECKPRYYKYCEYLKKDEYERCLKQRENSVTNHFVLYNYLFND